MRSPLPRSSVAALVVIAGLAAAWLGPAAAQSPSRLPEPTMPSADEIAGVRAYIARSWDTLTRSLEDLAAAAHDPKFAKAGQVRWPVYVARTESMAKVEARVRAVLPERDRRTIHLVSLPRRAADIKEHGLLYLPHPYVVPGGRFNEMYGWDSYFIVLGLLRDDRVELARNMVDNHLYQVRHYGTVLNANRTYYLSRSQPPFLSRMVRDVFDRTGDEAWLRAALPLVEKHYGYWTVGAHLAGDTGLSRYFDFGEGPAPEVLADERDEQGRTHYERIREYYRTHDIVDYEESRFYDRERDRLTPLFYKGDRSMRESGFDPSNRFGAFAVDVISYAPVCLNSLLYVMERDLAAIHGRIGNARMQKTWEERAGRRRERVNALLWDEAAGLYFDYNTERRARREYPFGTTFFPLWAGIASEAQAAAVQRNLHLFERRGGIVTSTVSTGNQWDAPFGWAPLQLMAVEGLRRYGFGDDADRLARRFISLVAAEFAENAVIVEKYDVVAFDSNVAPAIKFGYAENQVGFGWTNGVVLELLAGLR